MTSIAEPRRAPRPLAWVRIASLVLLLLLGGLGSSGAWGAMWLLVPGAAATGLLLAWRFGLAALVLPAGLGAAAIALAFAAPSGPPIWTTAWAPLGAAVGVWMGLHEEGGAPGSASARGCTCRCWRWRRCCR